jgi:NADH-quinone oxidoreductase subunit L
MSGIVLFLPLLSALTAGFFGRFLGCKGARLLTTVAMIFNAFIVLTLYYEVCIAGSPITLVFGKWLNLGWFDIDFSFSFGLYV